MNTFPDKKEQLSQQTRCWKLLIKKFMLFNSFNTVINYWNTFFKVDLASIHNFLRKILVFYSYNSFACVLYLAHLPAIPSVPELFVCIAAYCYVL